MILALEAHDFAPYNTQMGILESLKEHYPNFKITMFTVAWDIQNGREQTPITEEKFKPFVDAVKDCEDWIEIAVHGLTHLPLEFKDLSYDAAYKRITTAEKMFQNRGIKYQKVFVAPMWEMSKEAEKAAKDLGFKVLKDGSYDWNLKDDMVTLKKGLVTHFLDVPKDHLVIAHAHVQDVCGNGLSEVMPRLMQLPPDTQFIFLSEALKLKEQRKASRNRNGKHNTKPTNAR